MTSSSVMAHGSAVDTTDALLDAVRRHDAGAAVELMHGGRLAVDNLEVSLDDPREVRALLDDVFAALPDLSVHTVRTFAAEDRLAVELVLTGTLTGPLRGTPPTGRAAELFGRAVVDLTGDRRNVSISFDRETAMQQLGLQDESSTLGRVDTAGLRPALLSDRSWHHEPVAVPAMTRTMPPIEAEPAPVVAPIEAPARDAQIDLAARIARASGQEAPPADAAAMPAEASPSEPRARRVTLGRVLAVGVTAGAVAVLAGVAIVAGGGSTPEPEPTTPAAVAPPTTTLDVPAVPAAKHWKNASLFVVGGSTLAPGADARIAKLADKIQAAGDAGKVTVTAYTDNIGSPARNLTLSAQRAAAVGAALKADLAGTGWKVRTIGAGDAKPLVPNDTYLNQAKNRRVEVTYRAS